MSRVVSLRLRDEQFERLRRAARQLSRTPSETAALLLEESLREREFAFIEFRDTRAGREAFLKGTRLKVWQVAMVARGCEDDLARVTELLGKPVVQIQAALTYAAAYPDEMAVALADNDASEAELRRLIPNLRVFAIDASAP
jgi:uncharacterized protein (DUF433 family)